MPRPVPLLVAALCALWLAAMPLPAKDKEIVEPIAADDTPLPNPFKGFATDVAACYEKPAVPQTLAICTFTWAELEPERDNPAWAKLEAGWDAQLKLGRRIALRFRTCDPFTATPVDIPQWLVDKGVALRPYKLDGGEGRAPDWNNPQFGDEHTRILKLLGERYDHDPRIAFLDVGTYGFWGEWHTYQHADLAADDDHKRYMLDTYLRNFREKRLCLPYMDNYASRYAVDRNIGLRDNYIGSDADNQAFLDALTRIDPDLPATLFQSALLGGEFSGGEDGARATLQSEERFNATLDLVRKSHLSFLGPTGGHLLGDPALPPALADRLAVLAKLLGYHFRFTQFAHPAQVRIGETLSCTLVLRNDGVACFPYAWPVSIRMTSPDTDFTHELTPPGSDWDIRNWIPGEWTLNLDIQYTRSDRFQPGLYTIWLAVLDPATGKPGVALAQTGRAPADAGPTAGYYKLGTIKVVK